MARIHGSGLTHAQLSYLGALGDGTIPSVTGISAVDEQIYNAQQQLAEFKTAMTITTISSLAAAICGVLLIIDRGR